MSEAPTESIAGGGIVIFRDAIDDAGLLADFAGECDRLVIPHTGTYYRNGAPQSPAEVETSDYSLRELRLFPAIQKVATTVAESMAACTYLAINRQGPLAYQEFHKDGKLKPVAVVYGPGDGLFDYVDRASPMQSCAPIDTYNPDLETTSTVYRPSAFKTVGVGAGDVLVQLTPGLIHRGRNAGVASRITVGMYTR